MCSKTNLTHLGSNDPTKSFQTGRGFLFCSIFRWIFQPPTLRNRLLNGCHDHRVLSKKQQGACRRSCHIRNACFRCNGWQLLDPWISGSFTSAWWYHLAKMSSCCITKMAPLNCSPWVHLDYKDPDAMTPWILYTIRGFNVPSERKQQQHVRILFQTWIRIRTISNLTLTWTCDGSTQLKKHITGEVSPSFVAPHSFKEPTETICTLFSATVRDTNIATVFLHEYWKCISLDFMHLPFGLKTAAIPYFFCPMRICILPVVFFFSKFDKKPPMVCCFFAAPRNHSLRRCHLTWAVWVVSAPDETNMVSSAVAVLVLVLVLLLLLLVVVVVVQQKHDGPDQLCSVLVHQSARGPAGHDREALTSPETCHDGCLSCDQSESNWILTEWNMNIW